MTYAQLQQQISCYKSISLRLEPTRDSQDDDGINWQFVNTDDAMVRLDDQLLLCATLQMHTNAGHTNSAQDDSYS